jgi:hypothetical protein
MVKRYFDGAVSRFLVISVQMAAAICASAWLLAQGKIVHADPCTSPVWALPLACVPFAVVIALGRRTTAELTWLTLLGLMLSTTLYGLSNFRPLECQFQGLMFTPLSSAR